MSGYRNTFEASTAKTLPIDFKYEPIKLEYTLHHRYLPDFVNVATKTIVETKGRFTATDRAKMLAVKRQHPDWRIVIIFQNPNRTISKRSKTTYASWAIKNGFDLSL